MALKDKLMTLEDFKAVRDVDVASNTAQFTEIKADLGALIAPPRLDNNTDLDSVIASGVYTLYANSAYLNKPTQDAEHGILEVWHENYGDNSGRFFQRLTYTYKAGRTNSEIWVRSKSGAAGASWTPWISVSNMSINDAENLLQEKIGLISKIEGSYINLTTDPVSLTPVTNALWAHSIVVCSEGDKFIINADGGHSPRAWGFLDSANHVLSVCDASTVVEDLELTAPANAVKLIINDRSGEISYIVGENLVSKIRDGHISPSTSDNGELTDDVKEALIACFANVEWAGSSPDGDSYINALKNALGMTGSTPLTPTQEIVFTPNLNIMADVNITPDLTIRSQDQRQSFGAISDEPKIIAYPSLLTSNYSLIRVPSGKTTVTVTCVTSARCNLAWFDLTDTYQGNPYYHFIDQTGWQTRANTFTFDITGKKYIAINFESSDSNSSNYTLTMS